MSLGGARRAFRSLAVFAAVFLAAGLAVGFVHAAEEDEDAATFRVAEPRPGDVATYEAAVEGWQVPGVSVEVSRFQARWMPEERLADADGVERAARTLATRIDYAVDVAYVGAWQDSLYQDVRYDAATGRAFMVTNHLPEPADEADGPAGLPAPPLGQDAAFWERFDEYSHWLGPCGFRTALQDAPQRLDRPVEVLGRCDQGNETGSFWFRDAGPETVEGVPARRFQALHDSGVEVWYQESLPVPVRLRAVFTEFPSYTYLWGRSLDLRLVGFERGTEPYPPAPPPEAGTPRRVETAPRLAWGPDDAGLDHPFTLQEALPILAASAETPEFGRYLRDVPGAYLASAWSWKWTDEYGHVHRGWWMLATDGRTFEAGGVGRHPRSVEAVTLPEGLGTSDSTWRWRDSDVIPDDVTGLYPPAALAPSRLPTVAAALSRYEELRDDRFAGLPAERYGFALLCADDHCRRAIGVTGVGIYEEDSNWGLQPGPRDILEGDQDVYTMLTVDEDGRIRGHHRQTLEEPPFMGLLGLAPAGLPPDSATEGGSGGAPVWVAPSAPAAAGVGLLAALAALLYYAFAAKGLPFLGLFSRIGDEEILDHPARRRVYEAIQGEPGIHFQELSRRLAMGHGVLDHHLQKLQQAELVVRRQAARYTCFFPKGAVDRRLMDAAPVLRSRGGRQVLEAIRSRPGANHRDVASRAGLSPSTVSYHVRRLKEAGLVQETPVSGASSLHLTGMGAQAIGAA